MDAEKQSSAINKWWRVMPTILGIGAVVLGLDTLTKLLVVTNLNMGDSWTIIPVLEPIFRFTFITNTGAAFGMFAQFGGVFTIIGMLVIGAIIALHHHLPTEIFWIRLSLGLLLGGAMGNFIDRISRGYVIDFIDIGFWPIFNIADLAIVCGVAILSYHLWDEEELQVEVASSELPHLTPAQKGGSFS